MKIVEEFKGISGEICKPGQGCLTYFVRLAGCNLSCCWCDTKHAQPLDSGNYIKTPREVFETVTKPFEGARHVLFTGGEPFLQREELVEFFRLYRWEDPSCLQCVTIETNGSLPFLRNQLHVPRIGSSVSIVADYKLPSSGMTNKMQPPEAFLELTKDDYVKMVVATEGDLDIAIALLKTGPWVRRKFTPAISPAFPPLLPAQMIVDRLWRENIQDTILSVQIHKFLNLK